MRASMTIIAAVSSINRLIHLDLISISESVYVSASSITIESKDDSFRSKCSELANRHRRMI